MLYRGSKGVNPLMVFPVIVVDMKGLRGGGDVNPSKLVNRKRFLLKNFLVLVGVGFLSKMGSFL